MDSALKYTTGTSSTHTYVHVIKYEYNMCFLIGGGGLRDGAAVKSTHAILAEVLTSLGI